MQIVPISYDTRVEIFQNKSSGLSKFYFCGLILLCYTCLFYNKPSILLLRYCLTELLPPMVVLLISCSSFFWVTDCFPADNTLFRLFTLFGAYYF